MRDDGDSRTEGAAMSGPIFITVIVVMIVVEGIAAVAALAAMAKSPYKN